MKVSDEENPSIIDTTSLAKPNNHSVLTITVWKLWARHLQRKRSSLTWLVHWSISPFMLSISLLMPRFSWNQMFLILWRQLCCDGSEARVTLQSWVYVQVGSQLSYRSAIKLSIIPDLHYLLSRGLHHSLETLEITLSSYIAPSSLPVQELLLVSSSGAVPLQRGHISYLGKQLSRKLKQHKPSIAPW